MRANAEKFTILTMLFVNYLINNVEKVENSFE